MSLGSLSSLIVLSSLPLLWIQKFLLGGSILLAGILLAVFGERFTDASKYDIQFKIWSAKDCLKFLKQHKDDDPVVPIALLKRIPEKIDDALLVQEIAYYCWKRYPTNDEVVMGCFGILALVAKDPLVRERNLQQADRFGLNVPIEAMKGAMERAKSYIDQKLEEEAAELQCKACIALGALADGDREVARQIGSEGGLAALLQALSWYRFHHRVASWGLWAIFILNFEYAANKQISFEQNAIQIILTVLDTNCESVEVCRHGLAILFDMLREDEAKTVNRVRVLDTALSSGLHNVVKSILKHSTNESDIQSMGTELLVGTGGSLTR